MENNDIEIKELKITSKEDEVATYKQQLIKTSEKILEQAKQGKEMMLICSIGNEIIFLNNKKTLDTFNDALLIRKKLMEIITDIANKIKEDLK